MSLGIYIQVPFCRTKCTYCNFHTGAFAKSLYDPYVSAVCREVAGHVSLYRSAGLDTPLSDPAENGSPYADEQDPSSGAFAASPDCFRSLTVDTVYIGGGTPSLLDPAALERILETLRASFCCRLEEVTLEAEPETVAPQKAAAWRAAGFNRISLGAQSFDDRELQAAGRIHRREDILRAVRRLREAGFTNISLDLIAGLPHQTPQSWEESLKHLSRIGPEHVSIYLMEIDDGSRLGREVLAGGSRYSAGALPDDDAMVGFYERACEWLAREGYEHYEISNWAVGGTGLEASRIRPGGARNTSSRSVTGGATKGNGQARRSVPPKRKEGARASQGDFRSRHNLKYWRHEQYLGFGAGAHSFNGRIRWANAHDPAFYIAALERGVLPVEQRVEITSQQALEEELFLGLRQLEGINLERIEKRYNVNLRSRVESLCERGLVEIAGPWLRLAPSRVTVSNEVFVELLG